LAVARSKVRSGYVTAAWADVCLAAASACVFIGAATTDLWFYPRAELLGIHELSITPPYIWWVWSGILVCEPVVTSIKMIRHRQLLVDEARERGAPVPVKMRWVELLKQIGEVFLNWNSYVGRR
jgi:hypothetical protein